MIHRDQTMQRRKVRPFQFTLAGLLLTIAVLALCSGLMRAIYLGMSHEELARFDFGHDRTIILYAEGEVFYDPPGFLYYEVWDQGKLTVPERRFRMIGSQRKPQGTFEAVTSDDGNVVGIVYGKNVEIMHDFASDRTWPKEYGLDDASFSLGQELFGILNGTKRGLRSEELDKYAAAHNR